VSTLRGQHLHFEPTSGIAGDMTVAALVDLGVPAKVVIGAIAAMKVPGLRVVFDSRRRGAYVGKGFVVHAPAPARKKRRVLPRALDHDHAHGHDHAHHHGAEEPNRPPALEEHVHRDYAEIRRLLRRAKLDAGARRLAEEVFARLAEVEAALHGTSVERVSFHEVGAFDSIADVVGAAAAIAWLAPSSIGSSYPVVGTGIVRTAHGPVPVPAPATAELLRGVPILAEGFGELTTPTGAVLLACLVDAFGPPPPMTLSAIGYGAGTRELPDRANVLRVLLGRPLGQPAVASVDRAVVLQSNIDDMTPQLLAALMEALFAAGALDVWSTAITMKKGRPAQEVSALVDDARLDDVRRAFFLNSTTLGIRLLPVARSTLARSMASVRTAFGPIAVKISAWDGRPLGAQPEFDDCQSAAARAGVPVKRVWHEALAAASALVTGGRAVPLRSRKPLARRRRPRAHKEPA
jgi:uncharacterized protein (TIGR00299 family) protein